VPQRHRPDRPTYREHALGPKCTIGSLQSPITVKTIIAELEEAIRAVVDIEHDHIEMIDRPTDDVMNIPYLQRDPRI
jgi:hypothetical protein